MLAQNPLGIFDPSRIKSRSDTNVAPHADSSRRGGGSCRAAFVSLQLAASPRQHHPAGERWQTKAQRTGWFSLVKAAARPGRPREVTETGPRWRAATKRLAVCPIRLPVNFGDFEATGLLSTATLSIFQ